MGVLVLGLRGTIAMLIFREKGRACVSCRQSWDM